MSSAAERAAPFDSRPLVGSGGQFHVAAVQAVHGPRDVAAALAAFGLLQVVRAPSWLVVAVMAGVGQAVLA